MRLIPRTGDCVHYLAPSGRCYLAIVQGTPDPAASFVRLSGLGG